MGRRVRNVRGRAIAAVVLGFALPHTLSSPANAQDLNTVPGLQERLDHERSVVDQLLTAGECPRACLALEAMRQAADRICKLDAGRSGTDARRELEKGADRVKLACPDCEEAQEILHVRKGTPTARANTACAAEPIAGQGHASGTDPAPKNPPPKGGCAACGVGAGPPRDNRTPHLGFTLLAIACSGLRRCRR